MKKLIFLFILTVVAVFSGCSPQIDSEPIDDNRVLLQGFYWESYRQGHTDMFPDIYAGHPNIDKKWYEIIMERSPDIREARYDMIWLPPPSYAGGGVGYSPTELFNPGNMYGDSVQHRNMLVALWNNGIEPIADIVINHRNGTGGWASFINPDWDTKTICRSDEAFSDPGSEVYNLDESLRGKEEEIVSYDSHRERAYAYDAFRDIDHTNEIVQNDIVTYLLFLKSMGYRGWRYDMVHGFHASHIADYNRLTSPTFSVGEYDWDKQEAWRGWIWNTSTNATLQGNERLYKASSVFDFTTHFTLKDNIGRGSGGNANYSALYGFGNGTGLMGDNTDGLAWRMRSVTFLENHDTGWRTDEDGTNQENHHFDSFENNWQVEQGYAYILTHPGVPCVFWKHYFDWGEELQNKIRALINARKVAGVNAGSAVHTQDNARDAGIYAAMVEGNNGELYVRIGGDDGNWDPSQSNYSNYREYAFGNGWKVWVKLFDEDANSSFQYFPLNESLQNIPDPVFVGDIEVPQ